VFKISTLLSRDILCILFLYDWFVSFSYTTGQCYKANSLGEIIKRFEQKGYKLVALELMHPTKEHLEQHYGDLKTKSFFPKLVAYMISGPVVGNLF
jgi:hypothetical protein